MDAAPPFPDSLSPDVLAEAVVAGRLIPYLGPDLLTLGGDPPVPAAARDLAHRLAARVAVPGRIRNNLWHAAQYIETHRHRVTLDRLLAETFAPACPPTPLHTWLAALPDLPLIVDTWYDSTMATALASRGDWGLIQGASKARRNENAPWTRLFDSSGRECGPGAAEGWRTVLYKPHGAAQPAGDVLASDSDYVEVLCELDIQAPIPDAVQTRRAGRGFLFLGCRFYDQILRCFARSLMRRMPGPHVAVMPPEGLTRNELRFLKAEGIALLSMPLPAAVEALTR